MAFYGCYFSFDGVPCTEYGLMLYEFGTKSDGNNDLLVGTKVVEDRIARRYTPLHYGTTVNEPLEFTMTFGADLNAIDNNSHIDRWDIDSIANWLTAHDQYKWLEIAQPDMEMFRYKCFITELKYIDVGNMPWGFSCKVLCDSPFAYQYPEAFHYKVSGTLEVDIINRSACRLYYKPQVTLRLSKGGTFSIKNNTDQNRTMQFTGLPSSASVVHIDNENEIITCDTLANPYRYFNFTFLRLCSGVNHLTLNGTGDVEITCEFPINIGG